MIGWMFCAAALSTPAPAAIAPPRPRVEVAFVLDTTGSMGGLIEGAKRRIWSIARRIGEGRPRPELRVALVAYRDLGDAYVVQVHPFSGDMDEVHARLATLQASGGGDTPEHVSAALSAAVHELSWSRSPSLRLIFLVGDAPPHVDYQDGFDHRLHVRQARERGIGVETIQCGGDPQTAAVWRDLAALGGGRYAQIDPSGGMPVRITPVDAELASLNAELASTVVAGGSAAEQARTAGRLEARKAMGAPAAAEAAGYFAGAEHLADNDLVGLSDDAQRGKLEALRERPADAPRLLAGKSDDEALAFLRAQNERRGRIQARILELQKQREAFLNEAGGRRDAFDEQVVQSLRARAAAAGISY
jgi:hypothetical protein